MIYLHKNFHIPICNISLIITKLARRPLL